MISTADRERNPSRRRPLWPIGLIPALVALVAQLGLPHAHLLQVRGHESAREFPFPVCIAGDGSRSALPTRVEVPDVAPEHAEAPCAICQTLAQSHLALTVVHGLPTQLGKQLGTTAPILPARISQRRTAHAPRSPPFPA